MSSDEKNSEPSGVFPYLERTMGRRRLTARRAAGVISIVTVALTVAGGLLIRVADPDNFSSIGEGLWWAIQTLTTVGYGDVVPTDTAGRVIATIVMLNGIAFLTVITAAVTATLIEQVRRRKEASDPETTTTDPAVIAKLDEISARLDRIEGAIEPPRQDRG